jgi:small neutral amino acid transporter SnatA (MarC family)
VKRVCVEGYNMTTGVVGIPVVTITLVLLLFKTSPHVHTVLYTLSVLIFEKLHGLMLLVIGKSVLKLLAPFDF